MTKLQKSKKGFTLTELAIVIAVIAILIAVLVPTFVSLINKAQVSSDSQLVKNLNTALSVDEATNGQAETMSEALEIASENGYNVDKLTPSSSGDIVWDQESNRFLLIDEEGSISYKDESATTITDSDLSTKAYQLWYIVESKADLNSTTYGYSQYLAYDASGTTVTTTSGSVDVGSNTNVTLVVSGTAATSSSATNPVAASLSVKKATAASASSGLEFRVNSNGAKVTLKVTGDVTVYGTVSGNIVLESGKLTIAESAYVPAVYVTASAENASTVSITNNSSNTIDVASEYITVSTITGSDSTLSAVTVDSTATGYFAGGFGTENSPYQIETAEQLANINEVAGFSNTTTYYFELSNDIALVKDDFTANTADTARPNYVCYYMYYAIFDGNGSTITISSNVSDYSVIFGYAKNTTIKNLSVDYQNNYEDSILDFGYGDVTFDTITTTGKLRFTGNDGVLIIQDACTNLTVKNCVNEAAITDNGSSYNAVFVGRVNDGLTNAYITFENCENKGTFTGYEAAIFVANNNVSGTLYVTITNCKNSGNVRTTSMTGAKDATTNAYTKVTGYNTDKSQKISLISQIICRTNNISIKVDEEEINYYDSCFNNFSIGPDDVMTLSLNDDNTFTFTKSQYTNVSYYIVSIKTYTKYTAGGTWTYSISEKISNDGSASYTTTLKNLALTMDTTATVTGTITSITEELKEQTVKVVTISGIEYYLYEPEAAGRTGTTVTEGQEFTLYSVCAYDSDGNLLSSASV